MNLTDIDAKAIREVSKHLLSFRMALVEFEDGSLGFSRVTEEDIRKAKEAQRHDPLPKHYRDQG